MRSSEPLQRLRGRVDLSFFRDDRGATRPMRLFQEGAAQVRLPRAAGATEAVLINTGGGLTGGDRMEIGVTIADGAQATVTTQAAEKVYRAVDAEARIEARLRVGRGARLEWLPQETILFDGARLARRLEAELCADATLLAVEAVVFGRTARGEQVRQGHYRDTWRIARAGRLVYADAVRLDGDIAAALARPAVAGGHRAVAAVLYVAPDAEARIDAMRDLIAAALPAEGGASAWNGLLVARLLAADGQRLREGLVRLLEGFRGAPMPRVWMC